MSIAQIIQAMMSASPQVTPMGAAPGGGGGGGGGVTPMGANVGGASNMRPQAPANPQFDDVDIASAVSSAPDTTPLVRQLHEAEQMVREAMNPTSLRDAWNQKENLRVAHDRYAQARQNIEAFNQQQAQMQRGAVSREVFGLVAPIHGFEVAERYADLAFQSPDMAQEIVKEALGSQEAMRVEGREDELKAETAEERYLALTKGFKVDPTVANAFSLNTQDSMVDQLKYLTDKKMEEMEEQELQFITEQATFNTLAGMDNKIRQVNKTLGSISDTSTGLIGAILQQLPGTEAYELAGLLDTQRAVTAFQALKDMREASKTGGALGNVSNREIELLYKSFTALDEKFGKTLTRSNVMDVLQDFERVRYMLENEGEFERRFHEEGITGADMYREASEAVNMRVAEDMAQHYFDEYGYDVVRSVKLLQADPTAKNISDFEQKFGYKPLRLRK